MFNIEVDCACAYMQDFKYIQSSETSIMIFAFTTPFSEKGKHIATNKIII